MMKTNMRRRNQEYGEQRYVAFLLESTADSKNNTKLTSEKRIVFTPFRTLFSKEARKTYLGAILFLSTSIALFCVAAVAYWVFYLNYVPQIGLKRVVHLQFG